MAFDHFKSAQQNVYAQVLDELRAGRKQTHWIWFIFPQIAGLGSSPMSQRFSLSSLDEARAYAAVPVLFDRLIECCDLLLTHNGQPIKAIMGYPDDLKLQSSMTLFELACPDQPEFRDVLDVFFNGAQDLKTIAYAAR
jgi:uncharacterized protein (DUF1810 family)